MHSAHVRRSLLRGALLLYVAWRGLPSGQRIASTCCAAICPRSKPAGQQPRPLDARACWDLLLLLLYCRRAMHGRWGFSVVAGSELGARGPGWLLRRCTKNEKKLAMPAKALRPLHRFCIGPSVLGPGESS